MYLKSQKKKKKYHNEKYHNEKYHFAIRFFYPNFGIKSLYQQVWATILEGKYKTILPTHINSYRDSTSINKFVSTNLCMDRTFGKTPALLNLRLIQGTFLLNCTNLLISQIFHQKIALPRAITKLKFWPSTFLLWGGLVKKYWFRQGNLIIFHRSNEKKNRNARTF